MGYQTYAAAPQAMEPPEAQSIKSMLHIARILAIIFGILLLLAGLAYAAFLAVIGLGFLIVFPVLLIIWGVVDFVIYIQLKEIEAMVNQRKYEPAKAKTLIWMIIGFIIGGILIGILLLIAYLKFDPLITWQRGQMGAAPVYAAPPAMAPPVAAPAPMAPAPPPAAPAAAPAAPICPVCGQPTTYIAQYGRYYCYTDARYV
jgi:predicted lipid-binding transport protein (Tim44 family)